MAIDIIFRTVPLREDEFPRTKIVRVPSVDMAESIVSVFERVGVPYQCRPSRRRATVAKLLEMQRAQKQKGATQSAAPNVRYLFDMVG